MCMYICVELHGMTPKICLKIVGLQISYILLQRLAVIFTSNTVS